MRDINSNSLKSLVAHVSLTYIQTWVYTPATQCVIIMFSFWKSDRYKMMQLYHFEFISPKSRSYFYMVMSHLFPFFCLRVVYSHLFLDSRLRLPLLCGCTWLTAAPGFYVMSAASAERAPLSWMIQHEVGVVKGTRRQATAWRNPFAKAYSSHPSSTRDTFQDCQWMPKTTRSTKPYIYHVFSYTYMW